ncbi:hypothetical protein CsSME_00010603 [Camellia sinensis var. sinensis]
MSKQKFRTKKEYPQTSRGLFLLESNLKMAEPLQITTFKRSQPFISFSDFVVVCRYL